MALRLASKKTTKIYIGEGEEDFIEVPADVTRRQFSELIKSLPKDTENVDYEAAEGFSIVMFNLFVKGWSVVDDDDKPVAATEENYLLLSREAATLIDAAVMSHFTDMTPSASEQTKSEDDSAE